MSIRRSLLNMAMKSDSGQSSQVKRTGGDDDTVVEDLLTKWTR
jgi:hypothetical protein